MQVNFFMSAAFLILWMSPCIIQFPDSHIHSNVSIFIILPLFGIKRCEYVEKHFLGGAKKRMLGWGPNDTLFTYVRTDKQSQYFKKQDYLINPHTKAESNNSPSLTVPPNSGHQSKSPSL